MKNIRLLLLGCLLALVSFGYIKSNEVNDPEADQADFVPAFQPIIGIISQPVRGTNTSSVQNSYVNFIETGGGRVAPIPLDMPDEQLFEIAKSINGVLFPGGGTILEKDSRYYSMHEFFMDYSIQQAHMGNHFPVWGTCLGFQAIAQYGAKNYTLIPNSNFRNFNVLLPLEWNSDQDMLRSSNMLNLCKSTLFDSYRQQFTNNIENSSQNDTSTPTKGTKHSEFKKMLKRELTESNTLSNDYNFSWDSLMCSHRLFKATQWLPLAAYNHKNGVTAKDWDINVKLGEMFEPLAYSTSSDGERFVTIIEAKDYPIYGVQFHPEKNLFAFAPSINAPHGFFSAELTQYFANFLISEARKNNQRFPDPVTEFNNLIFQYQITNKLMSDRIYDFLPMYVFPMDPSMLYVTVDTQKMFDKTQYKELAEEPTAHSMDAYEQMTVDDTTETFSETDMASEQTYESTETFSETDMASEQTYESTETFSETDMASEQTYESTETKGEDTNAYTFDENSIAVLSS